MHTSSSFARRASGSLMAVLAVGLIACGGGEEKPATEAANTDAAAGSTAAPTTQVAGIDGKTEYENTCATCHQADGQGMPGAFPPLAGSPLPSRANPDRQIAVILKGLTGPVTIKGQEYNSVMAPWESLSDEQIAAIATYERSSWGNNTSAVTPEQVATIRAKIASRTSSWTIEELEKEID